MTTIKLQELLQAGIKEVLKDLTIFDKPINVYIQDIPLSKDYDFEVEESDTEKYFPCVIIKYTGGKISKPASPQLTHIEIIGVAKDWSADMSGYKNVTIVIDRIRDYLTAGGIHEQATIKYPIERATIDDNIPMPFFEEILSTDWEIDIMPYNDIEQLL